MISRLSNVDHHWPMGSKNPGVMSTGFQGSGNESREDGGYWAIRREAWGGKDRKRPEWIERVNKGSRDDGLGRRIEV